MFFKRKPAGFSARKIHDDFCVGRQIRPEQMAEVAAAGFRAVICNRPDGEEGGQPCFADIAAAARAAGLEAVHIPVRGFVDRATLDLFAAQMARLPKPVYAYCRSGARSNALWQGVRRR